MGKDVTLQIEDVSIDGPADAGQIVRDVFTVECNTNAVSDTQDCRLLDGKGNPLVTADEVVVANSEETRYDPGAELRRGANVLEIDFPADDPADCIVEGDGRGGTLFCGFPGKLPDGGPPPTRQRR